MSGVRDVFRNALYEGKGRNKGVQRKAKKAKKKSSDKTDKATSVNKATGVQSGTDPIGKYGKTRISSEKDKAKRKRGKQAQKRDKEMKDQSESISIDEDTAANDLITELVTDFEEEVSFQFNEDTINLLKDAFMTGFLASTTENNGGNAKAVYKNSALMPDGEVWNKSLKEKFRRFVYNQKKKRGG